MNEKQLEFNFLEEDIKTALAGTEIGNVALYSDSDGNRFYDDIVSDFKIYFADTISGQEYNVGYANGVTKGVLIFEPKKEITDINRFVIKIPFIGMDEYDGCSYYRGDDECFHFYGAENSQNDWDYCRAELELYEDAIIKGVNDFFVKTEYFATIHNYPVYKQEYAVTYNSAEGTTHTHTEKDEKRVGELCEESGCDEFNTGWLSDAYVCFGEDKFYRFLQFVDDKRIEDLHANNVGYVGLTPKLIDFSSFND